MNSHQNDQHGSMVKALCFHPANLWPGLAVNHNYESLTVSGMASDQNCSRAPVLLSKIQAFIRGSLSPF